MDNIRITSGEYRGRNIKSPASALTHPMGAREKLALFNILSARLPGAVVLDAFAGSGALGIEALSRGAKKTIFVEKNLTAMLTIKANCQNLGIADTRTVYYQEKVGVFCDNFAPRDGDIDIILADPPYDNFDLTEVAMLPKCLSKNGVLALSHPGEAPGIAGLELQKTHKYAGARISIYSNTSVQA